MADRLPRVVQRTAPVALRDALLPKLISGEMRVPDAKRIVRRQDATTQGRKEGRR